MKGHAKTYFTSSNGTIGIHIKEIDKIIFFDGDRCRKITGLTGYVSEFFSNCLRVYAPITYNIYTETVSLEFPLEDIEIVCSITDKIPSEYVNKMLKNTKELE